MSLSFQKYQGLGNDFLLLDNRQQPTLRLSPQEARHWCDRHFGVGADGVIFLLAGTGDCDYQMRMYNADGSVAEMCGNGIRCLAKFIFELEGRTCGETVSYRIDTLAGVMVPHIQADGQVTVDMGTPQLLAQQIPTTLTAPDAKVIEVPLTVADRPWLVTCVSMGNPHCVTFVEDVAAIPLETLGPLFEHHAVFPQRTNTEFVQVLGGDRLRMRVWERGAGMTLACGTGACATVVAAVLTGRLNADAAGQAQATVELPGGDLHIRWDLHSQHLYMTGPAVAVFRGTLHTQ
ncbi:diaminopimelate epimerase [Parathermosynechococcus lividus]